jgi:hypothetical protein
MAANALGFGFGGNLDLVLLDLLADDFLGPQAFLLGLVECLLDGHLGLVAGHFSLFQGCGTLDFQLGVVIGNIGFGGILAFHRVGFLCLDEYTLIGFRRFLSLF